MVVAVLPCAALILYDIIRAAAANRPEPEVVPLVKNADEELPHSDIKLSVDTEGKASYAKDRGLKRLPQDNDVLFNYSGKQRNAKPVKKEIPKNERPIIPLTDKKPKAPEKPKPEKLENPEKPELKKTGKIFDIKIPAEDLGETLGDMQAIPAPPQTQSDKTAEIPAMNAPKKPSRDAFFAQPSAGKQVAPQIGAQRRPIQPSAPPEETARSRSKPEKGAGKLSTQILASKSFDDLLSDDDDTSYSRSASNSTVDDILAGLDRRQ